MSTQKYIDGEKGWIDSLLTGTPIVEGEKVSIEPVIDIDPEIEKEIALIQEAKLSEKIKEIKIVEVKEEKPPIEIADELGSFFTAITEEKSDLTEKIKKEEVKIAGLEDLFNELSTVKKKKKVEKKKVLLLEPEKEVTEWDKKQQEIDKELEAVAKQIEERESVEAESINEYKAPDNLIDEVKKKIASMKNATELDKDRIKKLESIDSLDKLKREFLSFRDTVSKQMGTIGGGGETQLRYLDDVDISSALIDKRVLQYDSATSKFVGTTLETEDLILNGTDASGSNAGDRVVLDGTDSSSSNAGDGLDLQDGTFGGGIDLSAVDQDVLPSASNTYDLGSTSRRWNDLFLAGDTIDLAGATISSDGTGAISIAATGATLPANSKAGDNELAVMGATSTGTVSQPIRRVDFFSAAGGLSTANAEFEFKASVDQRYTFIDSSTFTLANGDVLADTGITLFQL
jgi:hypothetical protein